MIRESLEFSKEESSFNDFDGSNYDLKELMQEANKLYQRKIDKEIYKQKIYESKKLAKFVDQDFPEGTSLQSLMRAYKKVIEDNNK